MGLLGKGSKVYSIFGMKCPRCHTGDLFPTGAYSFKQPFDMHSECSHCHQNYMPEPGFYYGAMFISYIMTAFFCLGFVGILILGLGVSIPMAFVWLMLVLAINFVWIFRLARALWINVVIHFDKKYR
jgi:hypothetical protein